MKTMEIFAIAALMAVVLSDTTTADESGDAPPRIAWYSTLELGLEEAKRSNRPILFTSAAPSCLGVSGIW